MLIFFIYFQLPGGAPGAFPGMPGPLPGMPGGMQQRLDISNPAASLAQSLGLSRQQEHLMSLAGSSAAAQAAAVASVSGGLGAPPPSHNPEKMGMTNVSFFLFYFYGCSQTRKKKGE